MSDQAHPSGRRSIEADHWNQIWKENEFTDWDTLCQDVYEVILAENGELRHKRILEAGSGSGRISMRLAQDGAEVTLMDFSIEALEMSQRRYAARGVTAEYVQGPIENMSFTDDTFDVVFNTGVLEHYTPEEQVAQLQEMARVLKPGGLLIVFVPYAGALLYQMNKWFRERTGTWEYDYENPLWEVVPLLNQAGLEGAREYSAAFNTLCEIGRGFRGGQFFSAYQEFWYHQLPSEERRRIPGYLLVGVGRKPGGPPVESAPVAMPVHALPQDAEIVVLSSCNWDYLWQRPQQMAKQFSALGHRTIFVNGSRASLTVDTDMTSEQFLHDLADTMVRNTKWSGETAVVWPITRIKMAHVEDDVSEAWLLELIKLFNLKRPIFWTISFEWGPQVELLKQHGLVVYDCVDELSGFSWATPAMVEMERQLLDGADIVTVSAQALLRKRMPERQQIYLVPNGVNPEQFRAGSERRSKRPVIGFLGALANWLDMELVAQLAEANPNWTFLLVGSHEGADLCPVEGKPNIVLTGRVEYNEVPSILERFDVGIIPFKVNELTHNANPIKVYEYMAAGLPVVATPFAENDFFGDKVLTASSVEGFTAAIQKALASRTPDQDQERQAYARQHSWRTRALVGSAIAMAYNQARRGKAEAATETLRAALEIVADDAQSATELQAAAADMDLAHLATEALDHNLEQTEAVVQRLLERHAYYAALSLARQMYVEHPENPDAGFNYAVLLLTAREPAKALPLFLGLAENGDTTVYSSIASALSMLGHERPAGGWTSLAHAVKEGGTPNSAQLQSLIEEARTAMT